MAIFTHVTVGTNDLARARTFYDKVLGALGYKRLDGSRRERLDLGRVGAGVLRAEAVERLARELRATA